MDRVEMVDADSTEKSTDPAKLAGPEEGYDIVKATQVSTLKCD